MLAVPSFLEDSWLDFLDFLKGESDSETMRGACSSVRYLVVAGDLVDGIGIYPDQEMELDILDVYDQYKKAAKYFREIPEHIRVIHKSGQPRRRSPGRTPACSAGKHSRRISPRMSFSFGNPALVELDGVPDSNLPRPDLLMSLVATIPGISYQEPAGAVLEMLKRRHLAPTPTGASALRCLPALSSDKQRTCTF